MASKEVKKHLLEEYAGALNESPVWIKIAFKAFLQLPNKVVLNKPFLYFVLGKGTPDFKMTKYTSDYGLSKEEDHHCSNCIYSYQNVVRNKFICSQIRGEIEPMKWCRLWRGADDKNEK